MTPPTPTRTFLRAQVRWVLGRGVPAEVAEDLVHEAWEHAAARFDPARGPFEPLMQRIVRRRCADWWRSQGASRRLVGELRIVRGGEPTDEPGSPAMAAERQAALVQALSEDERRVFGAWALQRHLGKGSTSAEAVGAAIGLSPVEFKNAKRRLRDRLNALLARFGWSAEDVLHGGDDVRRTG